MSKYNPEKKRAYYFKNFDRIEAYRKDHFQKNKKRIYSYQIAYRESTRERIRELSNQSYARTKASKHAYYVKNKERIRSYKKEWNKKNMARVLVHCSDRHAIKLMARPPWICREDLLPFYVEARRRTAMTGIAHDVDHIWPLQGNGFVGLQVPWNLQVITKTENIRKHNKRPDEYIPCQ